MGGLTVTASNSLARGGSIDRRFVGPLAAARARPAVVAILLVLAGLAWWSAAEQMAGMDAGPGTDPGTLGWFVGVWIVMMAAMMFPSVAPTVALYTRMTRHRGVSRPLLFCTAYLVVWAAGGICAYAVFRAGKSWLGPELAWDAGGRWVAAGVVSSAALYELTPMKHVCLAKCRSPVGFLLGTWRDGRSGALRMGAKHAAWCVGCCWALMGAFLALGVMSLAWMALVAVLITIEKTLPWRRVAVWSCAAVLLILAVAMVAAPHAIPGHALYGGTQGGADNLGAMR